MYSKTQLQGIKTMVNNLRRRTGEPSQVSVYSGKVDDKEIKQVEGLFPGLNVKREPLGYLSFTK